MAKKCCANPDCQVWFKPDKYHPEQQYCGGLSCRNYCDRQRQRRHYVRHCRDPAWRARLKKRKQRERQARLAKAGADQRSAAGGGASSRASGAAAALSPAVFHLGMLSYLTGTLDGKEILKACRQCRQRGLELARSGVAGKNWKDFLTLASLGAEMFPHACSP
jgi:hypothetical protein